jgi:hypothetical protein
MVHFTCDRCGKDLTSSGDPRYVVKIVAYAGFDQNELTPDDLDDDHMEAVSELLQQQEHLSPEELDAQSFKGFRFDLCPECHARFIKDPLKREMSWALNFSKN